jgi:hypothetical protein
MEKELRKVIRKILNEIKIINKQPINYEFFDLGKEKQYGFQTSNDNVYYLSFLKTKININSKEINNLMKTNEVYAINFHSGEDNPNDSKSHERLTGRNELLEILSNIYWLILDFINNNTDINNLMFSAEPRRMKAYSNLLNSLKNDFYVFGSDMYDKTYKYNQAILIKK